MVKNKRGGVVIEIILILIILFLLYKLGWIGIVWDWIKMRFGR